MINFRPRFLRITKAIFLIASALAVLWMAWTWRAAVTHLTTFAALSVIRTVINGMLIVGALYVVGWFLPWVAATYVLQGVTPPRAPRWLWKYGLYASAALGLLFTPLNLRTHAEITKAVAPLADRFASKADCDSYDCYVPREVLQQRDTVVKAHGGKMFRGWRVEGAWRHSSFSEPSGVAVTNRSIYLWDPPFYLF